MNSKERQDKYWEKTNLRKSEFDLQNTNATRGSNPIMMGKNLLPTDFSKISSSENLLIKIFGFCCAALFFWFVIPLFENVLPKEFYDSLWFLALSLIVSLLLMCAIVKVVLYLIAKSKKKFSR